MRLFIAIDLPRSFKAEVTRIQKELKQLAAAAGSCRRTISI